MESSEIVQHIKFGTLIKYGSSPLFPFNMKPSLSGIKGRQSDQCGVVENVRIVHIIIPVNILFSETQ